MGVELIIIGIIAGASVLISGISAATSIGTLFFFKKKFKSSESMESKATTNVNIENEAIKEEGADGALVISLIALFVKAGPEADLN